MVIYTAAFSCFYLLTLLIIIYSATKPDWVTIMATSNSLMALI